MSHIPWSCPKQCVCCHTGYLVDFTHRLNPASADPGPLEGLLADEPAAVQREMLQMSPTRLAGNCPS